MMETGLHAVNARVVSYTVAAVTPGDVRVATANELSEFTVAQIWPVAKARLTFQSIRCRLRRGAQPVR